MRVVTEFIPSRDGCVRAVWQRKTDNGTTAFINRPIQRLFLFEAEDQVIDRTRGPDLEEPAAPNKTTDDEEEPPENDGSGGGGGCVLKLRRQSRRYRDGKSKSRRISEPEEQPRFVC